MAGSVPGHAHGGRGQAVLGHAGQQVGLVVLHLQQGHPGRRRQFGADAARGVGGVAVHHETAGAEAESLQGIAEDLAQALLGGEAVEIP